MKCPGCQQPVTVVKSACVLEALASVLIQRGRTQQEALKVLKYLDPDVMWEEIGPLIDGLEYDLDHWDEFQRRKVW